MQSDHRFSLGAGALATMRAVRPMMIAALILLALWVAVWSTGWVNPTLLASPLEVYKVLVHGKGMEQLGSIYEHAGQTILRALKGWLWSVLIGTGTGVL